MTGSEKTWVVLLRGINVNPSTKVAMSDLRALLGALGYRDVRTLLQSGNVLLASPSRPAAGPIEASIAAETGVKSKVVVLSVDEVRAIADANPLVGNGADEPREDLSKLMVTFFDADIDPATIERPSDSDLAPERLVITPRAIYQWCPDGILQSRLKPSWWRQFSTTITARNVRTVNRILAAAET